MDGRNSAPRRLSASSSTTSGAWIQLDWTSPVTIGRVAFDTVIASAAICTYSAGRALAGGDFQYWDGSIWQPIVSVTGHTDDWEIVFPTLITTTKLRLFNAHASNTGGQMSNPVIFEWFVYCQ